MLRIGEFSKMAMATVKTLRHYDELGLLKPRSVDRSTGYRLYEASQLADLHLIQSLRQAGFSLSEVSGIVSGDDARAALEKHVADLQEEIAVRQDMLSRALFILEKSKEDETMSYSATVKHVPEQIIYCKEFLMPSFREYFTEIPALGERLRAKYPDLKLAAPEYCYVVNLDAEWKETDNRILFCEAVAELKEDFDGVRFERTAALDVVSVMHQGAYEEMGSAFAYAVEWIERNGYEIAGEPRSSYIDGIWNKDDVAEWLTEVQIPIKRMRSLE